MTMNQTEEMMFSVKDIDATPAASVRDSLRTDSVETYCEKHKRGTKFPPLDVFACRSSQGTLVAFLGDGNHRLEAWKMAGLDTVRCLVRWFDTVNEAEVAAYRHAVMANDTNAIHRSKEDKRAAIRAALLRPENAELSDNKIGEMCGDLHHNTVSNVRHELTGLGLLSGRAASTAPERGYKKGAKTSGGYHRGEAGRGISNTPVSVKVGQVRTPGDEKPGQVRTLSDQSGTNEPTESGLTEPNAGDVEVPRSESGNVTSAEPPEPKPSNREIVRDAAGRPIPAALASQFVAARDANRDAQKLVKELRKFIGSMAHQEWGKGIPAILSTVEAETKTVGENVASSIPAYLCPHTDDAGVHVQPGNCKVCHGRGWLSRHVYRQLPDPVKQICKDRAEKAGEETEPCDDPESEVTVHENDDKRGGGWNGHVSSRRAS